MGWDIKCMSGIIVWCTQYCTAGVLLVSQYCTAGVLLVFVYCTAGVRAIGVNRRRASNKRQPFVPMDAGGFYSRKYGMLRSSCSLSRRRSTAFDNGVAS